jgi:flagellar biosynthesis anti-sigma factor FlgM
MSFINSLSTLQSPLTTQGASRSIPGPAHQATAAYAAAKVQASNAAASDETSISRASVLINQALAQPDIRVDKVAQIQQALVAGTYHVSTLDLAEKLITTLQG